MTTPEIPQWELELESLLTTSVAEIKNDQILIGRFNEQSGKNDSQLEIPLYAKKKFKELYYECFGDVGYFKVLPPSEHEEAKKLIVKSYIIAEYAHQKQKRGTKDPETGEVEKYINHPLAVALSIVKMKMTAHSVASALMHDVDEDGKNEGFPVDLEDINRLFNSRVMQNVDHMSQVRKTQSIAVGQKEIDEKVETKLKIFRALKENPEAVIIKIKDRCHNMQTIHGKKEASQLKTALDTLEVYVPLALLAGLTNEARYLLDESYKIIDQDRYKDGFAQRVSVEMQRFEEFIQSAEFEVEFKKILNQLPKNIGIEQWVVEIPSLPDFITHFSERKMNFEDLFLDLKFILADQSDLIAMAADSVSKDNLQKIKQSFIVNYLQLFGFELLQDTFFDETEKYHFLQFTHPTYGSLKVRVSCLSDTDYLYRQTPLSYLDAIALTEKDAHQDEFTLGQRRVFAKRRYEELKQWLENLEENSSGSEDLLNKLIYILPGDNIAVIGQKNNKDVTQVIIPNGATVLDYAIQQIPNSWEKVHKGFINGKFAPLNTQLKPGDTVHLEFSSLSHSIVNIHWLKHVTVAHNQELVAKAIKRKINDQYTPEVQRNRLKMQVKNRGRAILDEQLKIFGVEPLVCPPEWASEVILENKLSVEEFEILLGLGLVEEKIVDQVANFLGEHWSKLSVITIDVKEAQKVLAGITDIISNQHQINIEHITSMNTATAQQDRRLVRILIDPTKIQEIEMERLIDALSEAYPDCVRTFRSFKEYVEWLKGMGVTAGS